MSYLDQVLLPIAVMPFIYYNKAEKTLGANFMNNFHVGNRKFRGRKYKWEANWGMARLPGRRMISLSHLKKSAVIPFLYNHVANIFLYPYPPEEVVYPNGVLMAAKLKFQV